MPYPSEMTSTTQSRPAIAVWALGLLPLAYVLVATNLAMIPKRFAPWHDVQRILEIGLLATVVAILVVSVTARRSWFVTFRASPLAGRLLVGGFFALGIASTLRAELPQPAAREWTLYLLLGILTVAVATARREVGPRFDDIGVTILVIAAILYLLMFVGFRLNGFSAFQYRLQTVGPMYGFSHPRFFGQYAVWVIPMLIAAAALLDDGRRLTRAVLLATGMGMCALVIEATGRAAFAALFVALVGVLIAQRRHAFHWGGLAAIVLAGGTAIWFAATRVAALFTGVGGGMPPPVSRAIDRGMADIRTTYWREGGDMIRAHPFLGVGPEHYSFHRVTTGGAHPHSAPVQLAAEWGLVATALLLVAVVWGIVAWVRRAERIGAEKGPSALQTGLLASVIGSGFNSLFDGVLVMPVSQVLLVLVVGWMLGIHTADRAATVPAEDGGWPSALQHAALPVIGVTALVVLVWTAGPYLYQPRAELERYIDHAVETYPGDALRPRFWIEGRLPEP